MTLTMTLCTSEVPSWVETSLNLKLSEGGFHATTLVYFRLSANNSGAIAPRLSNNDPCTSNCGKLILVAHEPTKPHGDLPIITFEKLDFSAESIV
jgi:hypothetical protein